MKQLVIAVLLSFILLLASQHVTHASQNILLTSQIEPGWMSASIRSAQGNILDTPYLNFDDENSSCKGRIATNLGNDEERLFVENPQASTAGWTLSIGVVSENLSGKLGPEATECSEGAQAATTIVNTKNVNVFTACQTCKRQELVLGTSEMTVQKAAQNSFTLAQAGKSEFGIGRWYLTDIEIEAKAWSAKSNALVLTAVAM
jgi:hypothetical protein